MNKINFTKESLFDIEAVELWYEEQRIGLSYDFELCLEAGVEAFQKKYKNIKIKFISRSLWNSLCIY